MHLLHILLRILAGIAGAVLLYEDEEARIQNRLDALWSGIDKLHKHSLSWESAFLQTVSRICTQLLDRIFGTKIFSLQSTAVVFVASCVSFIFFTAYLGRFAPQLARSRTTNLVMHYCS